MPARTPNDFASPYFIVSCSRSGSTLLRYIIDAHPDICCPGELRLGNLCALLTNLVDTLSLGQVAAASSRQKERDPLVIGEVSAIVRGWMSAYTQARGKRHWCEKDPSNSRHLNLLAQVFPDAKFICLYRHCMDVVHSLLEIARKPESIGQLYDGDNVGGYVDRWMDTNSRIVAFQQANPDRCLSVRYEDIVTDSSATLSRVFDFIGVPWDPTLLEAAFTIDHDRGFGDPKIPFTSAIHHDSIGNGATISMRTITTQSLEKLNRLLCQLGYAPMTADQRPTHSTTRIQSTLAREQRDAATLLRHLFESVIAQRLRTASPPAQRSGVGSTCKLIVAGDDTSAWTIDLDRQLVARAEQHGEVDCTITIESADLLDIAHGILNPGQAYIQRRVRIEGDLGIATNLWRCVFACLNGIDQPPREAARDETMSLGAHS